MKQVNVAVLGAGKAGFLFGKAVNASANGRLVALCNADGWLYQDVLTWVEADGRRTIAVYETAGRAVAEGRRVDVA
jgi:hypothetical protein